MTAMTVDELLGFAFRQQRFDYLKNNSGPLKRALSDLANAIITGAPSLMYERKLAHQLHTGEFVHDEEKGPIPVGTNRALNVRVFLQHRAGF